MNCQEFWNRENFDAAEHLDECPACAEAWSRQRAVSAGVRALAPEWRLLEAPAHLESRVVTAFRKQAGWRANAVGPRWTPVLAGFSAAAVLALAAFLFVRGPQPPTPARRASPSAVQLAAAPEVEDADNGFIPAPNTAQLDTGEEVNLVRVEVPRSAMIALGYEVSADRALEPVSADVMLGVDGLVRAVRFLDE